MKSIRFLLLCCSAMFAAALFGQNNSGPVSIKSIMAAEVPLTISTGLVRTGNTITLDQSFSAIWTGPHVFNMSIGVGASPSTDLNTIGSDVNEPVYLTRSTNNGSGTVSLLQHNYYSTTPIDNTQVLSAGLFDVVVNSGAGVSGGAGHAPALIGRATDGSSATSYKKIGVEGKVHTLGTADGSPTLWGIADYDLSTAAGRTAMGIVSWAEFFTGGNTGSTINTGGFRAFYAQEPSGGDNTQWVALYGDPHYTIRTGGGIFSFDASTAVTQYIEMFHNGTGSDGFITTNSGNIQFTPAGGFTLVTGGLVPISNGGNLGLSPNNKWSIAATDLAFNGGLKQRMLNNFSTTTQTPSASTRTYIVGSGLTFTAAQIQQGTIFHWRFNITKTAAGIATSTFDIAFGTAGTTSDTARVSFTKPAGTAASDEGWVEIYAIVQTNSSSGIVSGEFMLGHNLSATGHATIPFVAVHTTSGTFDTTTPTNVGICLTSGASDAITINNVTAWSENI